MKGELYDIDRLHSYSSGGMDSILQQKVNQNKEMRAKQALFSFIFGKGKGNVALHS